MTTKRRLISGLIALGFGGLLAGLPTSAARADEPDTVAEALAKANEARKEAHFYGQLGGVGYKTGLQQQATAEAARHDAKAAELAKEEAAKQPAPAPQTVDCAQFKELLCD
jgi:hypothetical protein